jgi:3',5'-cyclic-AMP phosphodiesterase
LALVLAHVSDLHVSTFGDTFHDTARIVRRSKRLADASPSRFEVAWEEAGWRVLHAKGAAPAKIALLDPEGYSHAVPSQRESSELRDPVERAAAKACRLEARRAPTLAGANPTEGALALML